MTKCVLCREEEGLEGEEYHTGGLVCNDCLSSIEGLNTCVMCAKLFIVGEDGNELGFCFSCQNWKDFPYDLDKYYKDHDEGKVAFKGFDTMDRGILEEYRK